MSDLTELYKMQFEAFPNARKAAQENAYGQLQMQQLQEAMEAERGLRKLFAENATPSMSQIGQYSPEAAFKLPGLQLENQIKQSQLDEADFKANARIFGAISDRYAFMRDNNVENWEQGFKKEMGNAARMIVENGGRLPRNFNPEEHDVDFVLGNSAALGYPSQYLALKKAQMDLYAKANMPGTYTDPNTGMTYQTPSPMSAPPLPSPSTTNVNTRIPPSATNPNVSETDANVVVDSSQQMQNALTSEYEKLVPKPKPTNNPVIDNKNLIEWEQGRQKYFSEKATKQNELELAGPMEQAKEEAKLAAQSKEDAENKLSTIASMPADDEIRKYLMDATQGKIEETLKGPVASAFHVSNAAQAADTVLSVLQQNIKNIATKAKGDMNIKEVEAYDAAVGALDNKNLDPMARYRGYVVARDIALNKIKARHPDLAKKYNVGGSKAAGSPKVGSIEDGHEFLGGDPSDPKNWRAK